MNSISKKALLSMLVLAATQANTVHAFVDTVPGLNGAAVVSPSFMPACPVEGAGTAFDKAAALKLASLNKQAAQHVADRLTTVGAVNSLPGVTNVSVEGAGTAFDPFKGLELDTESFKDLQLGYKDRAKAQLSALWTTLGNHRKKSVATVVAVAAIGALLASEYGAELREQVGSLPAVQVVRNRLAQSEKSVRSFVSNNQDTIKKVALGTGAALVAAFGGKKAWQYFAKKA